MLVCRKQKERECGVLQEARTGKGTTQRQRQTVSGYKIMTLQIAHQNDRLHLVAFINIWWPSLTNTQKQERA